MQTQVDNFTSKTDLLAELGIKSVNTLKTYAGCYGINTAKSAFSEDEVQAIKHARHYINTQKMSVADYKTKFCQPSASDDRAESTTEDESSEDLIGLLASRYDNEQSDLIAAAIAERIAEGLDYKVMQCLPNAIMKCVGLRFSKAIGAVPHIMSLPRSSDQHLAIASIARSA